MKKISKYFKGVAQEARRVRWPHKKELLASVVTVCAVSIVAALIIYFEDWITIQILRGFEDAFPQASSSSSSSEEVAQALLKLFR